MTARRADRLFARLDGRAFSPQALDRLVRGLAQCAGVVLHDVDLHEGRLRALIAALDDAVLLDELTERLMRALPEQR